MTASNIVIIRDLYKIYQQGEINVTALNHISLDIQAAEFLALMGPSGSGKSTLLRIASGLEKSYKGEVILGPEISRQDMSFVFQQFGLLPWLTVYQNIELGLLAKNLDDNSRQEIVTKELKQFGLLKFANNFPKELSGGMKQRVGIARALATEPKIIFMDEPFSELDSFTAEELRQELLQIWATRRPTIMMVTHIVAEALELADRIAVLTPRPAHLERVVKNTLSRPRILRSSDFYRLEDQLYSLIKP